MFALNRTFRGDFPSLPSVRGSALAGKTAASRERDLLLKVLTPTT